MKRKIQIEIMQHDNLSDLQKLLEELFRQNGGWRLQGGPFVYDGMVCQMVVTGDYE